MNSTRTSEGKIRNTTPELEPWEAAGLPGRPIGDDSESFLLGRLIRDGRGTIITAPRHGKTAEYVSDYLGKEICEVTLADPEADDSAVGESRYCRLAAFTCADGERLSALERQAVAALAWHDSNYLSPLSKSQNHLDDLIIPTAYKNHVIQREFYLENDAYQISDVIERIFGAETRVFQDGQKWFVTVDCDCGELSDMYGMTKLYGILEAFEKYTYAPRQDLDCGIPVEYPDELCLASRSSGAGLQWQERMDQKAASLFKIDVAITEICSRLRDIESAVLKGHRPVAAQTILG